MRRAQTKPTSGRGQRTIVKAPWRPGLSTLLRTSLADRLALLSRRDRSFRLRLRVLRALRPLRLLRCDSGGETPLPDEPPSWRRKLECRLTFLTRYTFSTSRGGLRK